MNNAVEEKSFAFAVRIINLCKHLVETKSEYVLTKQLMKSGTSIGANITEAQDAQSTADFISKLSISLKEARETEYWLRLLYATQYLKETEYASIAADCKELERLLTAIIKTAKSKRN